MSKDEILVAAITCSTDVDGKCSVCPMDGQDMCKEHLIQETRIALAMDCMSDMLLGRQDKWPESSKIMMKAINSWTLMNHQEGDADDAKDKNDG